MPEADKESKTNELGANVLRTDALDVDALTANAPHVDVDELQVVDALRVGVTGAGGGLGSPMCEAIENDVELNLVARVNHSDDLSLLAESGAQVVLDVTNAEAARHNLKWMAQQGIHVVVGTTGFSDEDIANFDSIFKDAKRTCFIVPNFSIGAVLLMRFAEQAANYFDSAEIVEMHHNNKKDAPSGTASLTAKKIAAVRSRPWVPDPTKNEQLSEVSKSEVSKKARGAEIDGVHVHSVRLAGLLAHQEVLFGSPGQTLTIRHDGYGTAAYIPGVLRSLKAVSELPPGVTVGLDAIL